MVETKRERRNRLKREWRAKNKDRYREIVKKSNLKNKDKIKERNFKYRKKNKDKIKDKYLLNREDILKQRKKYKKDNKEKIREQNRNYRLKNADKIKAYFDTYNKKNSKKIQLRRRKHYLKNKDRTLLINKIWLQNKQQQQRIQSFVFVPATVDGGKAKTSARASDGGAEETENREELGEDAGGSWRFWRVCGEEEALSREKRERGGGGGGEREDVQDEKTGCERDGKGTFPEDTVAAVVEQKNER